MAHVSPYNQLDEFTREKNNVLVDRFGRTVNYLRLSVTDRCDFRCTYCMAEDMTFLPRKDVLSLEELLLVANTFAELGVSKIRLTGGEPLVRKNILQLAQGIGEIESVTDFCLSTNASHLADYAADLKRAGLHRINISLDSLRADRFKTLTRFGKLNEVLHGIEVARQQNFKAIKINAVVLKNFNLDEAASLAEYALSRNLDISFIEEMPLGEINSHARDIEFVSSKTLRDELASTFKLSAINDNTGGPSRYWRADNYSAKIGFISPHSENFCASCNRVRVTASGRLLLCLGNEHSVDLRAVLRSGSNQVKTELRECIINAMQIKPEKHEFDLQEQPQILRFMSATGG